MQVRETYRERRFAETSTVSIESVLFPGRSGGSSERVVAIPDTEECLPDILQGHSFMESGVTAEQTGKSVGAAVVADVDVLILGGSTAACSAAMAAAEAGCRVQACAMDYFRQVVAWKFSVQAGVDISGSHDCECHISRRNSDVAACIVVANEGSDDT